MSLFPDHRAAARRGGDDVFAASFATSYTGVIAFLAVAAEGSFAKAGERLGIGRSAVSRNVQKLEAQLDARLLLRTTRCTQLTREGQLFYEHCRPGIEQIAQALDEMRELRSGPPRGALRIRAASGFGRRVVAPLLRGFRERYPEIALDLLLHDGPPDFAAGRIDVAFRDGILEDSQLIARRLMPMRLLVCASPAYASRHGLPRELVELTAHRCIGLRGAAGSVEAWTFRVEGGVRRVVPEARHGFNDPELAMQAALDGEGLAQLPAYLACEALREGRLLACLGAFADEDRGHYLCYPSRKHLPTRIRVFVDYMSEATRALDFDCAPGLLSLSA
ncbi:LysR family transcriptional regulator [Burkholderia gladioli]|uniref:LysR family transcriptional regulator n=1 Tax=Burkholderia gladioli TaxID=28095 RepID=UPI00163F4E02|nr:LysR family transcriptional regulator [Burkholderia gladioli]